MRNEKRSFFEIDMQKLILTYLNKWWLLLTGAIVAMVLAFLYTVRFVTPMYTASVTVYVNSTKPAGEEVMFISSSTITAAQRLVNTYIKIIESDSVLTKVAEASELDISASYIGGVMSAVQVDNTELFKVLISHEDPRLAAQIANAVAEVAPGEIEKVVEGSSTKIIDFAKVPTAPSSPNVQENCMIGGLIGFVLVLIYLTVCFRLDVRIKDEEELSMLFDVPVLGQIPTFAHENSKGYGAEGAAYDTTSGQQKGDAT